MVKIRIERLCFREDATSTALYLRGTIIVSPTRALPLRGRLT